MKKVHFTTKRFLQLGMVSILSLALFSCGGVDKPDVTPENTYEEANDDANSGFDGAEATKLVLDGTNAIEIKGTYASYEDKDFYRIEISPEYFGSDTAKQVELVTMVNGEVQGKLMRMGFPMTAVSYAPETTPMNHLLVGLGGGFNIKQGVNYCIVQTWGKAAEDNAESIYGKGNPYSIILK